MKKSKYEQVAELELDLHGYTTSEADIALEELIRKRLYSHVRIITGRGLHGAHGPVLRDFVKNYLSDRGVVWRQSKITDGGEGALEVFLN